MKQILSKTFGGLTKSYYFRQLFFGALFGSLLLYASLQTSKYSIGIFAVISTLLYPYARFLYETFIDFILGDNQFTVNALIYLFFKYMTIGLCWTFAIFIAPVGLLYLYIYHSRQLKFYSDNTDQQGLTE